MDAYRVPKEKDANFPVTAVASALIPTSAPAVAPAAADGGMNAAPAGGRGHRRRPHLDRAGQLAAESRSA